MDLTCCRFFLFLIHLIRFLAAIAATFSKFNGCDALAKVSSIRLASLLQHPKFVSSSPFDIADLVSRHAKCVDEGECESCDSSAPETPLSRSEDMRNAFLVLLELVQKVC